MIRIQVAASRAATLSELPNDSHREARIAGISLAAIYLICLLLTAVGMT
ncbi:hypothetical protein JQ625_08595 [Bradyrhizobium diazoefficiens]|nr:hypothetical protein [Bradyrhizobium diazoefficiens]MBR0774887.1 hypothetical protein [Bradyrhizobium diazoefficiens]